MENIMETTCPADEIVADYIEGRLSEQSASEMEEHFSYCNVCLEVLTLATSLVHGEHQLELEPVPAKVTDAAARFVLSQDPLLSDSLLVRLERTLKSLPTRLSELLNHEAWEGLQPQPVRGFKKKVAEDFILLRKTFQDVKSEIEVEKTGEKKALIRIRLLADHTADQTIRVTLKKGDREIASQLAEGAYVLFEDIPFGRYSLTFAKDGFTLGTYLFEIKETSRDRG
jgi:hypothetical protein